ncbi:MAG: PEGA domain-containing protein [Bdellovibrionota bacterium]
MPSLLGSYNFYALLFFLFIITSCSKTKEVTVTVRAKTNQGEVISDANIKLGKEIIGKTDTTGEWKKNIDLQIGEPHRIEVSKDSSSKYFAPDFMNFIVRESGEQKIDFDAVLYFVPKPSASDDVVTTQPVDSSEGKKDQKDIINSGNEDTQAALSEGKGSKGEEYDIPPETEQSIVKKENFKDATVLEQKKDVKSESVIDTEIKDVTSHLEDQKMAVALNPIPTKLTLSHIDNTKAAPYPMRKLQNSGQMVFTIYVSDNKKALVDADVYVGKEDKGDLKVGCRTNQHGRCVIRFNNKPKQAIKFIARKSGYFTQSKDVRVKHKGMLRFNLDKGETIDVFAITKHYNYTKGLQDVSVYVGGKKAGVTDRFGHFSYQYHGNHDDLLEVSLKPKGYLPEEYQTDFVVSGPMTLSKYFMPKKPPPVKMVVLKSQPAGKVMEIDAKAFAPGLDLKVQRAMRNHLFSFKSFQEVPFSIFDDEIREEDLSLEKVISGGWQLTDLKSRVDAIILPTLVGPSNGREQSLQLSIIDSQGKVIAAAKEDLASMADQNSIDSSVMAMADKITNIFPFEGVVINKNADASVTINLGRNNGRSIKKGELLEVYGVQSGIRGNQKESKMIATLTVEKVNDMDSICSVKKLLPRSTIDRGDQVSLVRRGFSTNFVADRKPYLHIVGLASNDKYSNISQANAYFNGEWIGASDNFGRIYFDAKNFNSAGQVKVIKHGYSVFNKSLRLSGVAKEKRIRLSRETAFLRVESIPSSAQVFVNDKLIGKTPLSYPIPVPSGFAKIEVKGVSGYKSYLEVVELEKGTLDLTGNRSIKLERDYLTIIGKLLKANHIPEAMKKLKSITSDHSDYLFAQHQIGELYLTKLDQPARAAAAFGRITKREEIKNFNDKRFIGSHIDEGIALFMTAEKLSARDKASAVAHYQKAIEVFEHVTPFLRFVSKEHYAMAAHNVSYYKALSQHKLWLQSNSKADLTEAVKNWRDYLDGNAKSIPLAHNRQGLIENARIYFKQAKASLATAH